MNRRSPPGRALRSWTQLENPWFGAIRSTTGDDVVLTFDDGPDPDTTTRFLDVLRAHDARATFFVLLTRVRRHPGLLQEILDAGHEVGLHGPDHRALTDFTHREARARTIVAREELEQATRAPIRWFRPPYGSQSVSSLLAVHRAGLTSVMWSATTWDWKQVTPAERRAKAAEGGRPGAILLAHDGSVGPSDGADDGPHVDCDRPALMDEVLRDYRSRGLLARSLGEVLGTSRAVRTLRVSARPRAAGTTDQIGPG